MGQQEKSHNYKYKNKPKVGASASPKNYDDFDKLTPSRFYTEKEEVTLRFYQTPKALFNNPSYKNLSLGAKLMYSILRDRLDISVKNDWKDEHGYIYLTFTVDEMAKLLEITRKTAIKHKKELNKYGLIVDKRLGQGNPNRIYVLKPEIDNFQKCNNYTSRSVKLELQEVENLHPIDTNVNQTNLNNVNNAISNKKKKRSEDKEYLASYIAEQLEDDHSLGFFRKVVDLISENIIYQALSEVKDTFLNGKIKKSKAALFTTVIKAKALEHNINLDIKKTSI